VAGELATEHPACKVTIVHSGMHLGEVDKKLSCLASVPGEGVKKAL
jgi:hypothetical protein